MGYGILSSDKMGYSNKKGETMTKNGVNTQLNSTNIAIFNREPLRGWQVLNDDKNNG